MRDKLLGVAVASIAGLTLLRLAMAGIVELLPEEAYYWTYAQHPAFGYYDHPPMVAWMISLGTALLGNTEHGVRLVNILLWIGTALALRATARIWFGGQIANWATILFAVLPIYVGVGFIVTPDGALLFFWTLTLLAISIALQTDRAGYWLFAGVTFGYALLSKYDAVLLAPSLLVFLLVSPRHRVWLRRPQPWIALTIALVVFSPVIVWNAQHEWASFVFQSTRSAGTKTNVLAQVTRFWVYQLAILTPVMFALLAAAAARAVRRGWLGRDDKWNFVASFSLPLFVLFALASLRTDIHINWTAPAFLSLTLGAAAMFGDGLDGPRPRRTRLWRVGAWTGIGLCVVVIVLMHMSVAVGKPKIFAYTRVGGWRSLAEQVMAAQAQLREQTGQQPFVLGTDKYNIAAELGFYTGQPENCVNMYAAGQPGLSYRFWTDLERLEGRPAVAVVFRLRKVTMAELHEHFDRVDEPRTAQIGTHGKRQRSVLLINCYGYHALPRPTNSDSTTRERPLD